MGRAFFFSGAYFLLPSSSETRILLVGDMHLGKLPGSLPDGLPRAALGPAEAWSRVIRAAREHRVHGVALAGDLVEAGNAFFEAYGPLERGVRLLAEEGIPVCAVAGNHDTRTLPALAERIKGFHLLGPEGTWSGFDLAGPDGPAVRLVGWSFPAPHHRQSPLDTPPPAADPAVITLGLLHGDLDLPGSRYAPVSSARLQECGYRAWFLGHVHLPGQLRTDGAPFYLGSLTALRPTEQGRHGPVLATVGRDGVLALRRLPLAPLRWERLDVDCGGLTHPQDTLRGRLLDAATGLVRNLEDELEQVQALGLRLRLTGQVARPGEFARTWEGLEPSELALSLDGIEVFFDKVANEVTGAVDLADLARHDHPAGILARQILILEGDADPVPQVEDPDLARQELVRLGRREIEAVDGRPHFLTLRQEEEPAELTDTEVVRLLLRVARDGLNQLLADREGGHAAL